MATDTAPKQTDAKPAEPSKDTTSAQSPAAAGSTTTTPATAKPKPRAKTAAKPRAKTAAKPRTRSTAASSRSRTASKSRSRKTTAARSARTAIVTATPRAQAKSPGSGQQLVAGVIDAQEKSLTAIVDYQTRAAELSQIPGVTAVAQAQAKVLRSVTDTYVSAARAFLK
jgi:hypothetical protein